MPHHTDHPDVREVKGKGRVVLGCMNSLSPRGRLLSLSSVVMWRVLGGHGMPAACRLTGAGGVVNTEARGGRRVSG